MTTQVNCRTYCWFCWRSLRNASKLPAKHCPNTKKRIIPRSPFQMPSISQLSPKKSGESPRKEKTHTKNRPLPRPRPTLPQFILPMPTSQLGPDRYTQSQRQHKLVTAKINILDPNSDPKHLRGVPAMPNETPTTRTPANEQYPPRT